MTKKTAAAVLLIVGLVGTRLGAQAIGQDQAVLDELRQIRQLLERLVLQQPPVPRPAPTPADEKVKLTSLTGVSLGRSDAPLTMVEFTDLQCPFCRQFHMTVFDQVKRDYIDTGKLRFITRDFPLESIHPLARVAAVADRCAAEQGKFWEMRHTILLNNAQLTNDVFAGFARDMGLDMVAFAACTGDPERFRAEVDKDLADGSSAGVRGTPSFVIGRRTIDGVDGVRIVGAQPFSVFDAKLKEMLAASPTTNP